MSRKHLKQIIPMSQKITDPYAFLRNLVAKKGKSDLEGVYLTSVNVSADANQDYGYAFSETTVSMDLRVIRMDKAAWDNLLVSTRKQPNDIVYSIAIQYTSHPVLLCFLVDGSEMSCNVSIPTLALDEFVTQVTIFQRLLKEVAEFAGKIPTSVRFSIGVVTIYWDDLVEYGEAQEVDVGF